MPNTYPPELEQFVQQELANGRYQNEDELLITALTAFRDMKQRHEELRRDVYQAHLPPYTHAIAQPEDGKIIGFARDLQYDGEFVTFAEMTADRQPPQKMHMHCSWLRPLRPQGHQHPRAR